jgi:hypothetical protein
MRERNIEQPVLVPKLLKRAVVYVGDNGQPNSFHSLPLKCALFQHRSNVSPYAVSLGQAPSAWKAGRGLPLVACQQRNTPINCPSFKDENMTTAIRSTLYRPH